MIKCLITDNRTGAGKAAIKLAEKYEIPRLLDLKNEEAVKIADFILIFEDTIFPHWSKNTRELVNLVTVCLGNGGAKSVPPRCIIEMNGIYLGRLLYKKKVKGYYGMKEKGAGYRLRWDYYTPDYVLEQMDKVKPEYLMITGALGMYNKEAVEEYLEELL